MGSKVGNCPIIGQFYGRREEADNCIIPVPNARPWLVLILPEVLPARRKGRPGLDPAGRLPVPLWPGRGAAWLLSTFRRFQGHAR